MDFESEVHVVPTLKLSGYNSCQHLDRRQLWNVYTNSCE